MPARTAKPRKSSAVNLKKGKLKIDQAEDKLKLGREETKENSDGWGIRIPSGFDPDPVIALRTSVKKDEPADDHGGVKDEDKKLTDVKPEGTKQERTKREIRDSALSAARLWEYGADGQPFIPRPSPVRNKVEDFVDPPDYTEQENLPQELSSPPSPQLPPLPSPQHSPQHSPRNSPQPQRSPQPQGQAQRLLRNDQLVPEVEVLLPRLKEVRRRQAARAAQRQPQQERRQAGGPMRLDQLDLQNMFVIKPEPEDDVPLVPLEEHDPDEAREVLRTAVQNLRNPDVKVKKQLLLSDEFLLDALTWEGINYKYPVPLPKEVAECPLHRGYISHLYGGNIQETDPKPAADKLEWHGLGDWIFLTLELNPHAPTKPGHCGLFFKSYRAERDWPDIRRTFIRVASGKWVYMGQYKFEAGVSLTTDTWKQQRPGVRRAWTKAILTKDFGADNCVEIWLRKQRGADYEITEEDLQQGLNMLSHIRANLTEEEVIGAFDRGEQEMGTYRMTCVGYEAEFIQVLVRNAPRWTELERVKALEKQRRKRLEAEANAAQGQSKNSKEKERGSKRKPIKIESDSEDDDGTVEVKFGSDDSYQAMPTDLPPRSSTGRPRRAAAMVKRQRTS